MRHPPIHIVEHLPTGEQAIYVLAEGTLDIIEQRVIYARLCLADNYETCAESLGIARYTLHRWRRRFPAFAPIDGGRGESLAHIQRSIGL